MWESHFEGVEGVDDWVFGPLREGEDASSVRIRVDAAKNVQCEVTILS